MPSNKQFRFPPQYMHSALFYEFNIFIYELHVIRPQKLRQREVQLHPCKAERSKFVRPVKFQSDESDL